MRPLKSPTPVNRNPAFDLVTHIATGVQLPVSGDQLVKDIDNPMLDQLAHYPSYPAGSGIFGSQSEGAIASANLTEAMSLDSGANGFGNPMDMTSQSDNSPNPGEGMDSYGKRNIGGR